MLKTYKISRWLIVLFSLALLGLFFMPISSLSAQYREDFSAGSQSLGIILDEEANVGISDYMDISFYSMLKISRLEDREGMEAMRGAHAIITTFIILCALVLLFSLIGLSVVTMIFDGMAFYLYYIIVIRILNSQLFFGSVYSAGPAFVLYFIVFIAILCIGLERIILWFATRKRRKNRKFKEQRS